MNRKAALVLPLALSLVALTAEARSDADFMKEAAHAGAAEIEASKLATKKSVSSDVKAFAESMIADHTKVADELKSLAAAKHVDLQAEPSLKQKAELKAIDAGDNAKFDARYAKSFGIKAHEETIKLFEEASQNATDADVKAWAQKTLPGLKHHLQMAQALPAASAK